MPADHGMSGVELLWGDGERPSRGPKPKLTLERIVTAAIGIADAEGLAAVSMQRVAAELGYTAMSLYRYVPGKEQLVEVMVDVAAGWPPELPGEHGWRAELEAWVRALWALYQRHPWALEVRITGAPRGPHHLAWFEAALGPLARAGLREDEQVSGATFLLGAVRQLATIGIDITRAREAVGHTAAQAEADYLTVLRRYVTADRFPHLSRLVEAGIFDNPDLADEGLDLDLHFGIQRLLDGIEVHLTRG
ncbi:DNA-binding transcriptional regulator, AcrR family [Amycolatopsis arida]|uniref:DNA-binding transcriptional regulator, AcrR family n=1 Tax=Amycolatopsis arida TaxID=587909 RepID=A0A1I5SSG8_9PSEU|nr:TetR/AcrR family transcriptional regulator [Amycolatopsis arida]TDX96367.1 AcrR family transcriptional regulator [Amycolatopsis arida]SFP73679.1 DNA-binding transcriptional regulator, AcrR family [Amycolatopsis arida]